MRSDGCQSVCPFSTSAQTVEGRDAVNTSFENSVIFNLKKYGHGFFERHLTRGGKCLKGYVWKAHVSQKQKH